MAGVGIGVTTSMTMRLPSVLETRQAPSSSLQKATPSAAEPHSLSAVAMAAGKSGMGVGVGGGVYVGVGVWEYMLGVGVGVFVGVGVGGGSRHTSPSAGSSQFRSPERRHANSPS